MKNFAKLFLSIITVFCIFCFVSTATALDVPLSWNADPAASGYRIYYGTTSGVYNGTGAVQGDSPVDVGDVLSATLTGLDGCNKYYLAIAAYDEGDLDGPLSAEVHTATITSVYADANGTLGLGDSVLITMQFSDTFKLEGGPLTVTFNTGQTKTVSPTPTFTQTTFTYTVEAGEDAEQLEITDIAFDPNTTVFAVYHDNQCICPLLPECGLGANGSLAVATPDTGQVTGVTIGCP